ncbi:MAG: hypothetical protein ACE5Q6_22660 [Dehalococcoidia bacterium]
MPNLNYTVEVDWDNDGTFDGVGDVGEDVTSRVLRLEWKRGKDRPHYLVGEARPGMARIVLNNDSGDYSPRNSSSPLSGNLKAGRPVRIRSNNGGADATRWQGFLQDIVPQSSVGRVSTVTLVCTGPLGFIAGREVEVAMQTSYRTDQAITALLDEIGWPAGDRDLDTGLTTMTRWWVDRMDVLQALRIIEETELGLFYETKDGKIAFRNRDNRLSNRTSQATFSDASGAALTYQACREADPVRSVYNIFENEVQLFTVGSLLDPIWSYPETTAPYLAPGESRTFWARYPVHDSPREDVGVDAWTTPAENTDYDANSLEGGGGTDLSSSIGVAVSKFGESMKITLTNNHATLPAYLVDSGGSIVLQARGTPVSGSDPIPIREEDSTSQTTHGQRTWQSRDTFVPSTAEAISWGKVGLDLYKDPTPEIGITVAGNRTSATLDEVQDRDLDDRITVKADGNAGLGFDQDWFIEGEHHVVNEKFEHRVAWDLSDATPFDLYWKLGTSALGTNTKPAY